jgi:hypothetical protein
MGYAYYKFDDIERGYSVDAICEHEGCDEKIDRGLSYLCYACTGYFCEEHRAIEYDDGDEIEFNCFAGSSGMCCETCAGKH